jgi:hypothetical protein
VVIDDFVRTGRNRATISVVSVIAEAAPIVTLLPTWTCTCRSSRQPERRRQIQMRCRPLLAGVEACKINEFDVLAGTCL